MSKSKNKFTQQKPQPTAQASTKAPAGLFGRLIASVGQVSQSLAIPKPNWNEGLLDSLHAALPDDRRAEFQEVITQLTEMGNTLQDARKTVDESLADVEARQHDLKEQAEGLEKKEVSLAVREQAVVSGESTINDRARQFAEDEQKKNAGLNERESDLEVREANARAGFEKESSDSLKALRDQIADMENQRFTLAAEIEQDRQKAWAAQLKATAKLMGALRVRQQELVEAEARLAAEIQTLDLRKHRFQKEQRSVEQLEKLIREQVNGELAGTLDKKDAEVRKLQGLNQRLQEKIEDCQKAPDEFHELEDLLNGRSPTELMSELDDLRRDCREKKARIRELESAQSSDDATSIRAERDRLAEELRELRPELEGLKAQDHRIRMTVQEKENLEREKRVLQQHHKVMQGHLQDLESRIKGLTDAQASQGAFPELGRMDVESTFQTPAAVQPVGDLKTFTEQLRLRIAASQPDNPLFFRLEDLQLFVGGLAMSQLHVLQGISGTGKTSLAKAFAEVVGGECTDIAVQAGWRDRADLLGHYNAFERRFYEKDCLQGLYQAQTPSGKDRINVILLDEMNLSRPEQYFADFLSALETKSGSRQISLMESAPTNAPRLLRKGREILLPENVWFIGTANQDETTNELADKTHDRAFVMELPRHDDRFDVPNGLEGIRYSFGSLQEAFKSVQKIHMAEAKVTLEFVTNSDLTKVLDETFGLGWGNRFERQAMKFLPVVKAAGGSFEMALDHLLASRMFRAGKVTGRYDIKKEDLLLVRAALKKLFSKTDPIRCLAAIEKDIKRLERGA